jgi:segregation and condensation protein A
MSKPPVAIDLPQFSGPLDLLLHLIDREELDITALSLTAVTDQYLQQVEALKENKVGQLIDFIVVGARLMVIKSRALLPAPPPVERLDDGEIEDPAEALVRQLQLYRHFREGAARLHERAEAGLHTWLRLAPPPRGKARLDVSEVSADLLHTTLMAVLARVAERQESVAVAAPRLLTIEGQIDKLRQAVRERPSLSFDELLTDRVSRTELSVTLLAVLELIKRQELQARQPHLFGPITLTR